ncbi:hypothetical protein FCU45_04745 [Sulfurimonas crateris]|uniref:Sulfotransferase family protein n=1 Tax=Sulfurimonas crateris TaxID=2574727 RepID=A0A4V5TMA7_9BACT|nr:hypothetical protein [Sulfurimonas crateris]TKI69923.1 hypothetical protein FCU45_04745 [Sulfurimonas crateris]
MKQTCILVLGMHRSGTSALTGTLNLLDIDLGSELMKANFANEKGFFENSYLMHFNDKLLRRVNSSWDDIFFDYDEKEQFIDENDKDELKNILLQEFNNSTLFAIKDPRICYLFPLYEEALSELQIGIKVLLPYRNPLEVAQSLEKRNGFSIEKSVALWLNHFLEAELRSRPYKRYFLKFDTLLGETEQTVKQIDDFLNTDLFEAYIKNKTEINSFLEPNLKHNNLDKLALQKGIRFVLEDFLNLYHQDLNSVSKETFDAMRHKNDEIRRFYSACTLDLKIELDNAKNELDNAKNELNNTKKELSSANIAMQALKQELAMVYESKSWKITKPLRIIKTYIKG